MTMRNPRFAMLALFSMAACAGICAAQAQTVSADSGAVAGQGAQSSQTSADSGAVADEGGQMSDTSGDTTSAATVPAGASQWTAGKTSFESVGMWGAKAGASSGNSWAPEHQSFADSVQPGGIWRAQGGAALPSLTTPRVTKLSPTTMSPNALPGIRFPRSHGISGSYSAHRGAARPLSMASRTRLAGLKRGAPHRFASRRSTSMHTGRAPNSNPFHAQPGSLTGLPSDDTGIPASLLATPNPD